MWAIAKKYTELRRLHPINDYGNDGCKQPGFLCVLRYWVSSHTRFLCGIVDRPYLFLYRLPPTWLCHRYAAPHFSGLGQDIMVLSRFHIYFIKGAKIRVESCKERKQGKEGMGAGARLKIKIKTKRCFSAIEEVFSVAFHVPVL